MNYIRATNTSKTSKKRGRRRLYPEDETYQAVKIPSSWFDDFKAWRTNMQATRPLLPKPKE